MTYRFSLAVVDEDTEEVIHHTTSLSFDSLVEKSYQIDMAIKKHEQVAEAEKLAEVDLDDHDER